MDIQHIKQQNNSLNRVKQELKAEFFGIDTVIDQIIDKIKPWYFFNASQTHPLVINLWGLTGTGKTSLVKRLVELLDKEQAYFRFEMNNQKYKDIDRQLTNAVDIYEGEDYIISLDEFQYIRTIDDSGNEIDTEMSFNLWDFVDTGEFDFSVRLRDVNGYLKWYKTLKVWIDEGFKFKNGYIYYDDQPKKLEQYIRIFFKDFKSESYEYVDRLERKELFNLFQDRFETIFDFESYFFQIDEVELLKLLYEASRRKRKTEKGDMSKSLIFIVGNLDEAYKMSSDFNPDINANTFYNLSQKIKTPAIKEALKKRFRNEQIARLGNNHVIYPALSHSAYEAIIAKHLLNVKTQIKSKYDIQIKFDPTVHSLIFNNGVYPSQGVRPLKSSLKTYIDANLGQILSYLLQITKSVDHISIKYKENALFVFYTAQQKEVGQLKIPIEASLDNIRQSINKNKQVVTAVHESGHALVSILLLNDIPSQLTSMTANTKTDGFTSTDFDDKLISKKDLINLSARLLGGLEAERLIFGEDLISLGSSSDLKNATSLILKSLYENAMGTKLGFYHNKSMRNKYSIDYALPELQQEAEAILLDAQKRAQNVLKKEKTLLLKLAQQLTTSTSLGVLDLKKMIKNYAKTTNLSLIEEAAKHEPHRDCLQNQLAEIPNVDLQVDERIVKNLARFLNHK